MPHTNKETIRTTLNVPKELRIAQYIYNLFRDHEVHLEVLVREKPHLDKPIMKEAIGIDIFDVSDAEFISKIKKGI